MSLYDNYAFNYPARVSHLENARKHHRLAHAFLVHADTERARREFAVVLAQIAACPDSREGRPCTVCRVCRQLEQGTYSEFYTLSPVGKMYFIKIGERGKPEPNTLRYFEEQFHLTSTGGANRKVGVIYDSSDDYSSGLYKGFSDKAAELGLEIVATTSFTADNKADLSTQVTQCQDAGADLVFLPIYYTEAAQILSYANKIGYAPKFFGCDGMDGILTVEGFDTSLAEGLVLMTPFDANASDEATQSFVAKFKEKMDGLVPNQFAADGYDVIYALYNAMTAAGITGSESASEICTALEAQFATMTIDGLTGTGMHWDENGMISKAPAAVVIENGVYVPMG